MADLTAPTSAPVSSSGEAWSFPRRFVALITSPKALFEHLAERPSWFLPFLVTMTLVLLYFVILWNPVLFPEVMEKLDESGASEQAVEMMTKSGFAFTVIPGTIITAMFTFIGALLVLLAGGFLLGGKMSYRQALSLVTHTSLLGILAIAVKVPLALLSHTAQVSAGPGMLLLAKDAEGFGGKFLANFLLSFDVFSLWQTALIALGVSVIARVDRSKAAVTIWAGYVLLGVCGALIGALTQH